MLSYKTAQFDAVYTQVRQDPWLSEQLHKLPASTLLAYVVDTYQLSEAQAEEVLKMVEREVPQPKVTMSAKVDPKMAQKQIVIPATADHPVSQRVELPEDKEAPDPSKVVVAPKDDEEKRDVVQQSIGDEQATRQEQLQNSLRAMEVVLHDFVQAMYGIELNHEGMGKLIETIIEKASVVAADQTAETVKQLASPFLGE